MIKRFIDRNRFALKWLSIAFLIKLVLFIFFAFSFYHYWPAKWITNGIFAASGDTSRYYDPLESFVNGGGYNSFCRMPGLLPIYAPLRFLFSEPWAKTGIILLQFLTSVVSVYLLARTAFLLFKKERIFLYTFFIYAFSSFVSIWDHVGYSDSFSVSFLIFSIYFLVRYKNEHTLKLLFLSGLFITWSLFFRPIHGIVIPIIFLFCLLDFKNLKQTIRSGAVYALPVFIFLGLWTYKNYSEQKKIIVLQGPLAECFPGITEELINMRNLIIAWGGDTQPWAKGSDAEWLLSPKTDVKNTKLQSNNIYTTAYTLDSLLALRNSFVRLTYDTVSSQEKIQLKNYLNTKSKIYLESYRKEHFFRYAFLNKFILARRLLLPPRLDDLPFPKLSEMNFFQKMVKGGYYLLLLLVNAIGTIGCFVVLRKRSFLPLIPLAFVCTLVVGFGYIEQRYLAPAYPFFVILTAYMLNSWLTYISAAFSKSRGTQTNK